MCLDSEWRNNLCSGRRTRPDVVRVMEKRSEKKAGLGDGERLLHRGLEGHSKDLGALGSSF